MPHDKLCTDLWSFALTCESYLHFLWSRAGHESHQIHDGHILKNKLSFLLVFHWGLIFQNLKIESIFHLHIFTFEVGQGVSGINLQGFHASVLERG